jgi:mono/diheme cytochrome c family protein
MKFTAGVVVALVLILLGGAAFIYFGAYDVAATASDASVTRWALNTAMIQSVKSRADSVQAPDQFTEDQVRAGFTEFNEMCVTCHGAPGKERGEIGKGLNPRPPNLSQASKFWSAGELFWIVKHGVKMTGMPAFGPTHSDDQIWSIVALLKQLPMITPEQYGQMEQAPAEQHDHEHSHEH